MRAWPLSHLELTQPEFSQTPLPLTVSVKTSNFNGDRGLSGTDMTSVLGCGLYRRLIQREGPRPA